MNTAMKQRLVGTVVIGCLAIIFIPALLDGEGVSSPAMTSSIPAPPPMPEVPVIQQERPVITADTIRSSDTQTDTQSAPEQPAAAPQDTASADSTPPAPERPKLNNAGIPATWTVRLGSFGEKANAQGLVSRLREQGYTGFSRPINSSRGPLTGVYVGPVLTETEAGSLQRKLASEFELEGVVVQFSIEELEQ